MKKHYAVCLVAAGLLSLLSTYSRAAATDKDGNVPATDPRLGLAAEFNARSPHPSLANQAEVVGGLVGTWDVEYAHFAKDGKTTYRTGEFIVGWVLDGRAILAGVCGVGHGGRAAG